MEQEMKPKRTQEEIKAERERKVDEFYHKANIGVFRYHNKIILRDRRSLWCCHDSFKIRKAFVWFVEWPWFDRVIITTILLNSLLLAFTSYRVRFEPSYVHPQAELFKIFSDIFSVIFIIECVCKVIAMGFFWKKNSYLRDAWNWLDFFIVIVSIVGWLPFFDAGALKALRTFRILRPLRSINSIPKMRDLITTLLTAIPGLMSVLFFLGFIFGIFAIFGVNQFCGSYYNRCRTTSGPIYSDGEVTSWPMVDSEGYLCLDDDSCSAQVEEGALAKCGNIGADWDIAPFKIDEVID